MTVVLLVMAEDGKTILAQESTPVTRTPQQAFTASIHWRPAERAPAEKGLGIRQLELTVRTEDRDDVP